jgi:hypothetical protein
MVICFNSFILSTAFAKPFVANNTPQMRLVTGEAIIDVIPFPRLFK